MARETSVEEPSTPGRESPEITDDAAANSDAADNKAGEQTKAASPPRGPASKIGQVVALLERAEGATLAELVEATG